LKELWQVVADGYSVKILYNKSGEKQPGGNTWGENSHQPI
jgi:hypothetical protein